MDLGKQAATVEKSAGVRILEGHSLIAIGGDDARSWLNGQLTNDLRATTEGDGVYCLAVTVKGKMMADVWALDRGVDLALVVPTTAVETLLESFDSQIIMEDVELEHRDSAVIISVQGPGAAELVADCPNSFKCDELGTGGAFVITDEAGQSQLYSSLRAAATALGGGEVSDAAWELARLRRNRSRFGHDFDERHYPQEAGLKDVAVSFSKGCYLGQEVVCTLESRGRLARYLVSLELSAARPPEVGSEIKTEAGDVIGTITSAVADPELGKALALGYVKRAHACVDRTLQTDAGAATVRAVVGGS